MRDIRSWLRRSFMRSIGATAILVGDVSAASAYDGTATPLVAAIGVPIQIDPTDGFHAEPSQQLRTEWSWESVPAGSTAVFDDADAYRPRFTPDEPGSYHALATFYDESGLMASIEYRERAGKDAATGTAGTTLIGVALLQLLGSAFAEVADAPLWEGRFDIVGGGRGKAKPGDCTLTQMNDLQAEIDKIEISSCLPPMSISNPQNRLVTRMENLQKMRNFSKKALAQAALNNICYRGGDVGHQEKLATLLAGMIRCNRFIQRY